MLKRNKKEVDENNQWNYHVVFLSKFLSFLWFHTVKEKDSEIALMVTRFY